MCANASLVPKLAVAALVLLVAARTFQTCAAHPRLLVPTGALDEKSRKLEAEAGGAGGTEREQDAGETKQHPDYTVAIARNPFSAARVEQLSPQANPSFTDDDLQIDRAGINDGERTKRQTEEQGIAPKAETKESISAWEEPLAEASESDATTSDTSLAQSSADSRATGEVGSVIYGQRIVPRIDPPAQEQHFFPSFASLFSPPPPPTVLGYNPDSSINRPRHPSGQLRGGTGRSHYGHHHHHHSPYTGFDGYGDEEDDSFGLFQGSEQGTHTPRPPPPVLQPPRTKPSYQPARQQSASVNADTKHSGILGSGNFAVMRGGTFYDEKDKSASELRGNYYEDPFGNGHSGPSYNSGSYHRGLPSNPRPRPGRDHFADFRDFADITAPKPAFSQLVVVYAANQNGSGVEDTGNSSGSNQKTPPRNIIERLKLLDREEDSNEESESKRNDQDIMDEMVLWDGEGGREDEEDEMVGDDREEEEADSEEGDAPLAVKIIPRPNNINEKLKLLDAEPELTVEEVPKKEKLLSLGKRKLALIKVKGKWVSIKVKRISKEVEPLLALS